MALIEGLRVKNFGTLKDVTMGKLWNMPKSTPLTPLTVVIGKNGSGKSKLFDVFGFLSDCFRTDVEEACEQRGRGGFSRLRSKGMSEPIEIELYYRESKSARPITYSVTFDLDKDDRPYVKSERLRQRRVNQTNGRPFSFMILENGKGMSWKGSSIGVLEESNSFNVNEAINNALIYEGSDTEAVELADIRKLGISTLGNLKQHPRISDFRRFIENWFLSYFTPDAARSLPMAGAQKRLNIHGDNLGNVVQYLEREHPKKFQDVLNSIASKIPGIHRIETERSLDSRLLIKFFDNAFGEPFFAQQMSDGTLKVFAYMVMLADPTPPPFICIEEPENGLYNKLLEILVREFREHAQSKNGSQIFMTTHQPYLVDELMPDEVWILEKQSNGFSTIRRASDDPLVVSLVQEGLPLGGLWYSDYLEGK